MTAPSETHSKPDQKIELADTFLRKQAWDYFATHASQRMAIFNFYIALSSAVAAGYAASFKTDSNLQSARWLLAPLMVFLAFVFWKLDQRNKFLIKNSERALKEFEKLDRGSKDMKVFLQEEAETKLLRSSLSDAQRLKPWKWHMTYSECFNCVYIAFAAIGSLGTVLVLYPHVHLLKWLKGTLHFVCG